MCKSPKSENVGGERFQLEGATAHTDSKSEEEVEEN